MRTKLLNILWIIVAAGSVVVGLRIYTTYKSHHQNSFVRMFPPHAIFLPDTIHLKYNSYYIAGIDGERIYLGNYTDPLHVLMIEQSQNFDTTSFKISNLSHHTVNTGFRLIVNNEKFFLVNGVTPAIITGYIKDWTVNQVLNCKYFFVDAVPFEDTWFLRSINRSLQNVLVKYTKDSSQMFDNILKKQVDGIFCTEGSMVYSQNLERIIYTYAYRNEIIQLDTNLNVIASGRTIDTITHAQIKVASLSSNKSITLAAPPNIVNKRTYTWGRYLFVQSNQPGKNEVPSEFDKLSVIDVYDLNKNVYSLSFYIYNYNDEKLTGLCIYGNRVVAIYSTVVVIYELDLRYFKV